MIGNKRGTEAAGLGAGNWVLDLGKVRIPKSEVRINAEIRMTNQPLSFGLGHSSLIRVSGFVIRVFLRLQPPLSSSQAVEERRMQR